MDAQNNAWHAETRKASVVPDFGGVVCGFCICFARRKRCADRQHTGAKRVSIAEYVNVADCLSAAK
ncbi:MAG: hypothetical protein RSB47_06075, partial [Ruthenibacterium sp.]